mmetsp:Transcript_24935/g.38437  ORF Transcript_24935/g.38437 Transcript_24935/m.38437 type:complete len:220 (-) Transcript_24935:272-931(-)
MQHVMIMRIARVTFAFLKGARQAKGDHRKHVEITKIVSSMLVLSKLSPDLHKWCVVPTVLVNSFMIGRFLLIQNLMMVASARVRLRAMLALSTTFVKVQCAFLVNAKMITNLLGHRAMTMLTARAEFVWTKCAKVQNKKLPNHARKILIVNSMLVVLRNTLVLHSWCAAQVAFVNLYMIGNTIRIPKVMMDISVRVRQLETLAPTTSYAKAAFVCMDSV